jgi:hypothetical protein
MLKNNDNIKLSFGSDIITLCCILYQCNRKIGVNFLQAKL